MTPRLELHELLLSRRFRWTGNPPATEQDLDALCIEWPVLPPREYLDLLRVSDGGDAEIAVYPNYVRVWSAQLAIQYNRDYEVARNVPGFVAFGDNGGSELVGFDTRGGEPLGVCSIPFFPMEWAQEMDRVADFRALLEQLLPVEGAG